MTDGEEPSGQIQRSSDEYHYPRPGHTLPRNSGTHKSAKHTGDHQSDSDFSHRWRRSFHATFIMTGPMDALPFPISRIVLDRLGILTTPEQCQTLQTFHDRLYEVNLQRNLTRIPEEEADARHYAESLLVHEFLEGTEWLDIGCGPGFPSFLLALFSPDSHVASLDSNGKMIGFLRENALPNISVLEKRMEDCGLVEQFDSVTGRAVAPLAIQLELSARAVKMGGVVVPFRVEGETFDHPALKKIGLQLEKVEARSLTDERVRVFPIYRKVARTPVTFPRNWAAIKKKPLF